MSPILMPAFALEIRREWAEALLSNRKTIELRRYRLPSEVGDSRVWLLATEGPPGQATLGDEISEADRGRATVVGWAKFKSRRGEKGDEGPKSDGEDEGIITYRSASELAADEGEHLVSADSAYGWKREKGPLFGWRVEETRAEREVDVADAGVRGRRLVRSVYRLEREPSGV